MSVSEIVSPSPDMCFTNMVSPAKLTIQQVPPQNSVVGAGPSALICFSSTYNLVEFLEIQNLGLNVNPKDQGCEVCIL